MSDPYDRLTITLRRKVKKMATFEFSEGFDAVAWHYERMSRPNYDEYYDEED
jgi:hypothetical protein